MANILIVDNDVVLCELLGRHLRDLKHHACPAFSLAECYQELGKRPWDVVFLDVVLPDGNGLAALPRIRQAASQPEVIVITAEGNPDGAERAIRTGAWDYLQKPISLKEVTLSLSQVLHYRLQKMAYVQPPAFKCAGIVGNSRQMKKCLELLAMAAGSDANVLITGETGTGKELFAQAIHGNSKRAAKNMVVVDCAALPETLVESILFGQAKGAFTGADRDREGLVAVADGGTLFLDEVGELPLSMQKTFLRVLQERRFRPVGGKKELHSDFRLVAATNCDLTELVQAGRFRKDLLFRLSGFSINLPALREHAEDIEGIAGYHVAKSCERQNLPMKCPSPDFLEALEAYPWPGNVRELIQILDIALVNAAGYQTLFPVHLPTHFRVQIARNSMRNPAGPLPAPSSPGTFPIPDYQSLKEFRSAAIAAAEKQYLANLMLLADNQIQKACRIAGVSRSRYYELLKRHRLSGSGHLPAGCICREE